MINPLSVTAKWSPVFYRALAVLLLGIFHLSQSVYAESSFKAMPHVGTKGQEDLVYYHQAGQHKAFAIAPGGAWSWQADAISEAAAKREALESCQGHTRQKCVLYALNDRIVFDEQQWPSLWGPYADKKLASAARTGNKVGQRFYNIRWLDAAGQQQSVSDLKGKVVFLHFWGSWCPPCMREFPTLKNFQTQIETTLGDQIAMVLLQVREPYTDARQWVEENGFSGLPLFDSAMAGDQGQSLFLADGSEIQDRMIARVFPSSYVLDKHGLVLFAHYGPVSDWSEYLAFLQHAVIHQPGTEKASK